MLARIGLWEIIALIVVFSIIGVLLVAITRATTRPKKKIETKSNLPTSYCRNCGSTIKEGQAMCTSCGSEPLKGHKHCQQCGAETKLGQSMCVNCKGEL